MRNTERKSGLTICNQRTSCELRYCLKRFIQLTQRSREIEFQHEFQPPPTSQIGLKMNVGSNILSLTPIQSFLSFNDMIPFMRVISECYLTAWSISEYFLGVM